MIALEIAMLVASVLNLFVTIAVAGSIMKLIKVIQVQKAPARRPSRQLVELPNAPTYADFARFPNYDGFNPQAPNWDGIPQSEDEE